MGWDQRLQQTLVRWNRCEGPARGVRVVLLTLPKKEDAGDGLAPGRGLALAEGAFIAASFSNRAELGSATAGAGDAGAAGAGGGVVGAGGAATAAGAGEATVGLAGVAGFVLGGRGVHASSSKPLATAERCA